MSEDLRDVIGEMGATHLRERGRLIRERDALVAALDRVLALCDERESLGVRHRWVDVADIRAALDGGPNPVSDADEAARPSAALDRVRALHRPHPIYDECGHEHTDADVAAGCAYVREVGRTCAPPYITCHECCTGVDGDQTADCADTHRHEPDGPICPTVDALDGHQ